MISPDDAVEIRADGEIVASCALWWSRTPLFENRRIGYIGRYACVDERAAHALLSQARRVLASAGCTMAIGPVDGSTWYRYRFATAGVDRPSFFLEPSNPSEYPRDFVDAGFVPLARYVSAEETQLECCDPRAGRAARRLADLGVRIRPFDIARFEEELDAVYDVACASFANALLFSSISRQDFGALYEPLRPYLDADFIRVAEHEGRFVGFAFGIPDMSALERGESIDAIVGKTQAVLPDMRYAGLGAVMLDDVRRTAHRRGMRRIIHALIHEDNPALNGSRRVAAPFRTYTLYESPLR